MEVAPPIAVAMIRGLESFGLDAVGAVEVRGWVGEGADEVEGFEGAEEMLLEGCSGSYFGIVLLNTPR